MSNPTTQYSGASEAAASGISKRWLAKFSLIDQAGGPTRKQIRQLPKRAQRKLSFNILAFIFGPFYYLVKGMWRKAITLSAVSIVATLALNYIFTSVGLDFQIPEGLLAMGLAASRANFDYYKKVVLADKQWW